jgi:hypothetical protein
MKFIFRNGLYYIEGVRNNSKKEMKEVKFDASNSTNLYFSTYAPKFSKVKIKIFFKKINFI